MDIFSEGNVTFAITLLKKLCEEKPQNVVFSPPSISFTLKMILLGTKKETATQIAQLLSLNKKRDILWGFRLLISEMNKSSTWYQLQTTNKIFGENTLNFAQSFRKACFKFCNSVMEDVCFSQEAGAIRNYINDWVAKKTEEFRNNLPRNGRMVIVVSTKAWRQLERMVTVVSIHGDMYVSNCDHLSPCMETTVTILPFLDNILEALPDGLVDPLSLLVFVNAINFKASWEQAFDPRHTYTDVLKINQNEKTFQIMKMKEEFLTYPLEELNGQLFIFPYRGMELTMILVFSTIGDLTKLEKGLTYERFITWTKPETMALMENHDEILFLPKIKIEETCDLEHILSTLGMSDAFDEQRADFSGMFMLKPLYLSKVLHKSYLEINEEGIKASAATIAAEIPTATKRSEGLKTNGFFLFFIWSYKTKSILFCGRVSTP